MINLVFVCYMVQGIVNESRVTDLSLSEFLLYGPQKETEKIGKTLMRKSKEGKVLKWDVDLDDSLCTLQEAFEQVEQTLGFNIELKFDDQTVYEREFLVHVLRSVLQVCPILVPYSSYFFLLEYECLLGSTSTIY